MERRRPTHDLRSVRRVLGAVETLAITTTALRDAVALGFDRRAICETIAELRSDMFYKSMTTLSDHRQWQDVYHATQGDLTLYVKVQSDVVTEFRLVSFKER